MSEGHGNVGKGKSISRNLSTAKSVVVYVLQDFLFHYGIVRSLGKFHKQSCIFNKSLFFLKICSSCILILSCIYVGGVGGVFMA